jgi:hypothetical protein
VLLPLVWPIRAGSHLQHRLSKNNSIEGKLVHALLAGLCVFALFLNTLAAILLIPGHFFGNLARLRRNQSRLFLSWRKLALITFATGFVLLFVNPLGIWIMFTAVSAFYIALFSYPIGCLSALVCLLPALGVDLVMRGLVGGLAKVGVKRGEEVNGGRGAVEWLAPIGYLLDGDREKGGNRLDQRNGRVGFYYCLTFAFVMSYPTVWLWPMLTTRVPPFSAIVLLGFIACLRPYRELAISSQKVPRDIYQSYAMEEFITELRRRAKVSEGDGTNRSTEMRHPWHRWRSVMVRQERRAREYGDACLERLLKERREFYQSNRSELLRRLKAVEDCPPEVMSDLDRIFAMLPLGTHPWVHTATPT